MLCIGGALGRFGNGRYLAAFEIADAVADGYQEPQGADGQLIARFELYRLVDSPAVDECSITAAQVFNRHMGVAAGDHAMLTADGISAGTQVAFTTATDKELLLFNRNIATRFSPLKYLECYVHKIHALIKQLTCINVC